QSHINRPLVYVTPVCPGERTGARCLLELPQTPHLAGPSPSSPFDHLRSRHSRRFERRFLAGREHGLVEIVDQLMKQPIPVDLGLQMKKAGAEPDRGAVHEHEFAGRPDAAKPANVAMDTLCDRCSVGGASLLLDQSLAIFQQWAIDELCPAVQHIDDLTRQIAETPTLISMNGEIAIAVLQGVVEIDDASHKGGAKNANATEI